MSAHLLPDLAVNEQDKYLKYYYKILDCKNGYMDFREYYYPIARMTDEYKDLLEQQKKIHAQDENLDESDQKTAGRQSSKTSVLAKIRYDSLARTRRKVIELTAQNADKFKTFITLTFKDNVQNVEKANQELNKYITSLRRTVNAQGRELFYLGVPEFQKRGAVHYHMFISEEVGSECIPYHEEPKKLWNRKEKRFKVFHSYDLKYWKKGFSQAQDLTDKTVFDDKFNLALYMCGYLYKDLDDRLFGHTKILKSNNLEKPIYRYLENEKIYQYAIKYITDTNYDICYYETDINLYDYLNKFKSHSVLLNKFDHDYISTILCNTQFYQSNS